jgi:hypothetical protein
VQTIKLAEILVKAPQIAKHDPNRARTYLPDARAMLAHLEQGNPEIIRRVKETLDGLEAALAAVPMVQEAI